MQILITGHAGFVGSRLVKRLVGYPLVTIDKQLGDNLLNCQLPRGVDTIIHLAAYASVEESWANPVKYAENLATTMRLVNNYPDAKIIHASSCATINPESPYGFLKMVASDYLKLFHKNYVNLVFPNLYGADSQGKSSHLSVVDMFKGKDEVTVYGDGMTQRDYVHVDDLVSALVLSLDWPTGEYFLGTGKLSTVLELAGNRKINFALARKEPKESVSKNTSPNWIPSINVMDYLCQK